MTRRLGPEADGGRLLIVLILLLGLAAAVAATRPSSVRAEAGGPLVAEPVLPASAAGVNTLFGASPGEAPGEVWGWGSKSSGAADIVRYTDATGWERVAEPTDEDGATPTAMEIPRGAEVGRTTPSGGVVTVATLGKHSSVGEDNRPQALLVRDQGGQFRAVVPPVEREETETAEGGEGEGEGEEGEGEEEAGEEATGGEVEGEEAVEGVLAGGEQLFGVQPNGATQPNGVKLAAVEEPSGKTGAFVVPFVGTAANTKVIHYDGTEWTSEPICIGTTAECELTPLPEKAIPGGTTNGSFNVIAIDATGPGNAWMLARRPKSGFKRSGESIILLRREDGQWRKQTLSGERAAFYSQEAKQESVEGSRVSIKIREKGQPPTVVGQPLTVTADGIWVDATIAVGGESATKTDATVYFDIGEGDADAGQLTGAWCSPLPSTPQPVTSALCTGELPSVLAGGEGRSFAWPGTGAPGDFGTRVITGIGKGAILLFENGAFTRIPLAGGGGTSAGAAIAYPEKEGRGSGGIEGWLGPSFRLTREPVPSGLVQWPVPFRRPLTAIAPQPGAPVGELGSQALAVGLEGQVAKYTPGIGWQPESLLTGSESRATPNLRAVAWPVPGFAYAVGDDGAMWIWRSGTNRWEADPGAPPNLIHGNFTGIAFNPNEPERGYAVGQQGLLLGYGRRWTQEELPAEVGTEANITSIAFAGNEAIATWSKGIPPESGSNALAELEGGVIVNSGSGWRVEPQATEALAASEENFGGISPRLVAGLPDGGAVISSAGGVIVEREAPGSPWRTVPGAPLGEPVALQAVREGGQLRAVVSVEFEAIKSSLSTPRKVEELQGIVEIPEGQAPLLLEPYPPAASGDIVRQTATGWRDEERQSYPVGGESGDLKQGVKGKDVPRTPAPILAFLVNPDGTTGWAVGGQTGQMVEPGPAFEYETEGLQTAAVMRIGENAAPPENSAAVPIPVPPAEATFAIGGNAECFDACADLSGTGIGPDVWLRAAVGKAAATSGVRAFLYTGSSVSGRLDLSKVTRSEFGEEEAAYMRRLGSAAGSLPVFTTPAESDRYESSAEPAGSESPLTIFGRKFEAFEQPLGVEAPGPGIVPRTDVDRSAGRYSYSFDSEGASGGPVRVIVLDYSAASLGGEEECWLAGELAAAKAAQPPRPAIVIGNREVGANDATLRQLLVTGVDETTAASCPQASPAGASGYFFDSLQVNTTTQLGWGSETIPAFGSGTLGYIPIPDLKLNQHSAASGFLLASVDTAALNPMTNVAPVTVRLIPSIGSLALNALDGTLVRRSQPALFEALAARPQAGFSCGPSQSTEVCGAVEPDPYVQIPTECRAQASCLTEIRPEYRFSSSRPDIANFVKVDPSSSNPRAVFLNPEGKPEPDPTSGLLCAFNSGTTTVSIETGGLSYSVPVTVQKGSVARPCGTVPRTDLTPPPVPVTPPPLPAETPPHLENSSAPLPPPAAPQVPAPNPVIPTTPAPTPIPIAHHVPPKPPAPFNPIFIPPVGTIVPNHVVVPPAPPAAAEPAPPTGTSPVTQPAVSPEPEEEEEAAFDLVHHAVAVRHARREAASIAAYRYEPGGSNVPWLLYALPTLVIIAALSTSGIAGRRRRRSPEPAFLKSRR